jgi:hypothetical protein
MDSDVSNSIEAIASLVYLIRMTLNDPSAAITYVNLADERLKAIALHFGSLSPMDKIASS